MVQNPNLTLRGLMAERMDRRIAVSHDSIWHFQRRERAALQEMYGPPRRY